MLKADGCTYTYIRPKGDPKWYKRLTDGYAQPGER